MQSDLEFILDYRRFILYLFIFYILEVEALNGCNGEQEARLWLDTQSHASSSVSSDSPETPDCYFSWPTSFWTQFKVAFTNQLERS